MIEKRKVKTTIHHIAGILGGLNFYTYILLLVGCKAAAVVYCAVSSDLSLTDTAPQ